MSQSERRECIT